MVEQIVRASWGVVMGLCIGCGAGAAEPNPPPAAPTAAPASTEAHAEQGLAAARALATGDSSGLQVACDGAVYLGPFELSDGETVTLEGTHTEDLQTCIGVEFVDGSDVWVSGGGFGCSDGGQAASTEASYEYSPSNGGNAASPVYAKVVIADPRPEPCGPARVMVRRTR